MARPTIVVEIAFASNPFDSSYTWTDVSAYLRTDVPPISIRRGRQYELNRIEAGEATIVLDNRDRRFDPTNTAGPYYPNVVPVKPIRISAVWAATTYRLFTGYIEAWPPAYDLTNDSSVTIRAADAFKLFNLQKLNTSFLANYSNDAIVAVLNAIGWPVALRTINITGSRSLMQAVTLTDTPALQHLQNIAESENGVLFMDGAGRVTWQGRHWRLQLATTSQGTFGDSVAELPYSAIAPSYDDTNIWNDIRVTRQGGTTQVGTDSTSQNQYGPRTLIKSGLLITDDNEANDAADYLALIYAQPQLRFQSLTMDGQASDSLWPHVLGREINERITAIRRPPGGGTAIQQDCYIEAIEHQLGANLLHWDTTWQLSPAGAYSFFILDDTTLGRLDFNALAY